MSIYLPAPQRVRALFGALLLSLLCMGTVLAARPNYQRATRVAATNIGCTLVACGAVADQALAVDSDTVTSARVTSPEAVSAASLRLQFPAVAPAGYRAGLALSSQTGLDLSTLGNVRVRTFLGNSATPLQDLNAASLLTVAALDENIVLLTFPVTADFDQIEVRAGGLVTLSYTVRVHYAETQAVPTPLPVTLTRFAGRDSGHGVDLTWETATEQNSSHFLVERSLDGRNGFEVLGWVAGQGNSVRPRVYRFRDLETTQPLAPLLYYRLRQVDLDGHETFAPILVIRPAPGAGTAYFRVYPTPVGKGALLRVAWERLPQADQYLRLYNSRGQLLYHVPASDVVGNFQPPTLAAGLYLMALVGSRGEVVDQQQLVVQD